jgi:hypothetical protein
LPFAWIDLVGERITKDDSFEPRFLIGLDGFKDCQHGFHLQVKFLQNPPILFFAIVIFFCIETNFLWLWKVVLILIGKNIP